MKSSLLLAVATTSLLTHNSASAFSVSTNVNNKEGVRTVTQISSTVKPDTEVNTSDVEIVNPRLEGLAFALDDGTRKSHSVAENTAFVKGFFKGLSTRKSYGALLTSLYFIYEAMEAEFDNTAEESVRALDDPLLRRVESLQKDLEYFYDIPLSKAGVSPYEMIEETLSPSTATKKYIKRIRYVSENKPYLLIGHQYTRYLGDLFGGQMMGKMATRSLTLNEGKGVDFYTFEDISNVNDFITEWYSKLNALDITEQEKQDIVDEANLVFSLNIEIFEELDGSAASAFWSLIWNSFKEKVGL